MPRLSPQRHQSNPSLGSEIRLRNALSGSPLGNNSSGRLRARSMSDSLGSYLQSSVGNGASSNPSSPNSSSMATTMAVGLPIHDMVWAGEFERAADLARNRSVDVCATDGGGNTALHVACQATRGVGIRSSPRGKCSLFVLVLDIH